MQGASNPGHPSLPRELLSAVWSLGVPTGGEHGLQARDAGDLFAVARVGPAVQWDQTRRGLCLTDLIVLGPLKVRRSLTHPALRHRLGTAGTARLTVADMAATHTRPDSERLLTGGETKQAIVYPASLATIVKEVGVDARVMPFAPASFALVDRIAALLLRGFLIRRFLARRLLTVSESGPARQVVRSEE